ncbi:MAG: serine/threonine-protein kinase [Polyangiaceae bacterium]
MDLSDQTILRIKRRVGTIVRGTYTLERLLGIGGMGGVFAARTADGRTVALKMLHPELSRVPSIQTRFFREAYAGNAIAHPGVARVFEHGTDDEGCAFLVMELLDGETLEALWERSSHRLPMGLVLAIAERLLEVLHAAHAKGIVHRDIKPDNVFLTRAGELKVLDFGIARLVEGTSATASGELMGTPAFMPPEQAGGNAKTADARSDVWSVGALLYTMISGKHVHEAPTHTMQMIYAATQKARSLAVIAPETPHGIVELVDRALAFDREARWPSAEAMLERVQALTSEAVPPTMAVPGEGGATGTEAPVSEAWEKPAASGPAVGAGPTLPMGRMVLDELLEKDRERKRGKE